MFSTYLTSEGQTFLLSVHIPSLSGFPCVQNPPHSISPLADAMGAKLVSPPDFQSMNSRLLNSCSDWKSGGDTNFAPIASAKGEMECGGFWTHGKPDKDGIWTANAAQCPTLVGYVESVGARYGRVRIIKLNPADESSAMRQLHLDDNN